jgi:uncharacterized protein (TIGR00725 family)
MTRSGLVAVRGIVRDKEGAKNHDPSGLTIGILPGKDKEQLADCVDVGIVTGMDNARNNINILSSDVVIACGVGAGSL